MHSVFQIFSPPEHPVLSLEVQANMVRKEPVRMDSISVLARLIFDRFFDNPLTSLDGENRVRVVQILCVIAIPGLLFALALTPSYFIFPPNTAPRAYWPRVSDHYFYVTYASVAVGIATVFAWDRLFPDLIDVLVLTPLPVPPRKFFVARIAALGIFLGLFLLASGCIGSISLPLIADEPSLVRHLLAHMLAISAGGLFTAALFVAGQGILLGLLGEKIFRWISPILQALSLTLLLVVLFLVPLLSQNLRLLLTSDVQAARWFPPFWFLGLYQTLLEGGHALPVFRQLAATGGWALLIVLSLTCLSYPLAYRRKMRRVIEGAVAKTGRNWLTGAKDAVLHALLVLWPSQRAVYHFISQTLKRAPYHRVYLSMYGGAGLALLLAATIMFRLQHGHLTLVFAEEGLRSAIPVAAFLVVSGLKAAFLSPVELKANWIFHAAGSRLDRDRIAATLRWTLLRAVLLTAAVLLLVMLLSPSLFAAKRQIAAQLLLAQGLCLLLIDAFFLPFLSVPFTMPLVYSKRNLVIYVAIFMSLFPPFVWTMVDTGRWLERSWWHFLWTGLVIAGAHLLLERQQREMIRERAGLPESEEIDEFPQRLGLL